MSPTPAINSFHAPYRFLSNFAEVNSGLHWRGLRALTAEHLFAAAKTSDVNEQLLICAAPSPGHAKRMGRTVTLRSNWNDVRISIMSELIAAKFGPDHPQLVNALIATGTAHLAEGNSWGDTFWGVNTATGQGENWLGHLLMLRRSQILMGIDTTLVGGDTAVASW